MFLFLFLFCFFFLILRIQVQVLALRLFRSSVTMEASFGRPCSPDEARERHARIFTTLHACCTSTVTPSPMVMDLLLDTFCIPNTSP